MGQQKYVIAHGCAGIWMKGAVVDRKTVEDNGFNFDSWIEKGAVKPHDESDKDEANDLTDEDILHMVQEAETEEDADALGHDNPDGE